ncbi:MAG: zf-TFIIB domain-containing protein [Phycisphaerae bacterium]|nr:zf-TFIIB domain-containing protein [Phycisphaerae bacterium]
MDCPVCKNAMITLELAEVEIDYCTDCSGIWLDAGELESLLDDKTKAQQLLESFKIANNTTEKLRKCPICDKKMNKILVQAAKSPLVIDKCPKAHGLWFDKNELHQILKAGTLDPENKVIALLADIFAE